MAMGMSAVTNNLETDDIRTVLESTAKNLKVKGQKVKGGPALAKLLGVDGKKIIARINEWLGRDSDFIRDHDGKIVKDNQENIERAVELQNTALHFDDFSKKMFVVKEGDVRMPFEDESIISL